MDLLKRITFETTQNVETLRERELGTLRLHVTQAESAFIAITRALPVIAHFTIHPFNRAFNIAITLALAYPKLVTNKQGVRRKNLPSGKINSLAATIANRVCAVTHLHSDTNF